MNIDNYTKIRTRRLSNKTKGKLNLVFGCMFSGKTETLITRYRRYILAKKKCLVIKYIGDDRYSKNDIVTHEGEKISSTSVSKLFTIDNLLDNYDVILIDEIQFFEDAPIMCDIWANEGFIVECFGLNGTYNRTPFDVISKLIPLCDDIQFTKAICINTGNDAVYSYLKPEYNESRVSSNILIGGANKYSAYDRETFYSNKNILMEYYNNKLDELCDIIEKK